MLLLEPTGCARAAGSWWAPDRTISRCRRPAHLGRDGVEVPADLALVRAAVLTDADVQVLPGAGADVPDGAAALLRWGDGVRRRPRCATACHCRSADVSAVVVHRGLAAPPSTPGAGAGARACRGCLRRSGMDGVDGAWVAARAAEVQGLADDVRRLALAARVADDAYWRSDAAEAFRAALVSGVRALARVAARVRRRRGGARRARTGPRPARPRPSGARSGRGRRARAEARAMAPLTRTGGRASRSR